MYYVKVTDIRQISSKTIRSNLFVFRSPKYARVFVNCYNVTAMIAKRYRLYSLDVLTTATKCARPRDYSKLPGHELFALATTPVGSFDWRYLVKANGYTSQKNEALQLALVVEKEYLSNTLPNYTLEDIAINKCSEAKYIQRLINDTLIKS